jgi:hypothetical protein
MLKNIDQMNLWLSRVAGANRNYSTTHAQFDLLYRMYYTLTPAQKEQIDSELETEIKSVLENTNG